MFALSFAQNKPAHPAGIVYGFLTYLFSGVFSMRILARTLLFSLCLFLATVAAHAATYSITNSCSYAISATLNFSDSSTMPVSVNGNTTTGFDIGTKTLVSMTINGQTVSMGQVQQPVTLADSKKILVTVLGSGGHWEPFGFENSSRQVEW